MHKNLSKHWRLSWFRYETFITFLTFRLSTRGKREREAQFLLYWLFVQRQLSTHWPNKCACVPQQTTGLSSPRFESQLAGLSSPRFESQLASSSLKSQITAFFKIPKNPSPSLPGMTSFTSLVSFPIRGFYYDICDCHTLPTRAWTPALNVCPYPCTKPKSSKPN